MFDVTLAYKSYKKCTIMYKNKWIFVPSCRIPERLELFLHEWDCAKLLTFFLLIILRFISPQFKIEIGSNKNG